MNNGKVFRSRRESLGFADGRGKVRLVGNGNTELGESKMATIERNSLCPCGSGKKYKKCCMLLEKKTTVDKRVLGLLAVVVVVACIAGGLKGFELGLRIGVLGTIFVVGGSILLKAPKKKRDRDSGSNIDFGR